MRSGVLLLLWGGSAVGQGSGPDSIVPLVLERVTLDRWIQGSQHPGFVPFDSVRDLIHVRSRRTRARDPSRRFSVRLRKVEGTLSLDVRNRMRWVRLRFPPVNYSIWDDEADRAQNRRRRLSGRGAALNLPEARFWSVPFALPAGPLDVGMTWTDTLSFVADPGEGLSETLDGIWQNRVVGDTTIAGRTLPLVHSEATVRYRSIGAVRDYALEGVFSIEKNVAGVIVSAQAVDTTLGLRVAGTDSASWSGEAVLRTQDGQVFSTPTRYERIRSWVLRDSTDWAILRDSARVRSRRQRSGMLMLPTPLQERLARGDSGLVDSLKSTWVTTGNPNERVRVGRLLRTSTGRRGQGAGALEVWLRRARLALGDSASTVVRLLASPPPVLTDGQLEMVLPYLENLGRIWALGLTPSRTYANLSQRVLSSTPILEPDSSQWTCAPSACRRLRGMFGSASEVRLADVALVAAFARDPEGWYEHLSARADAGSLVAREAMVLARGVGATWKAAPHEPVPESGAGWRRWLSWMGGDVRFRDSHRKALLMFRARTGRDPPAELREAWPPEGDSARFVIGTILREMGALGESTTEELVAAMLSGSTVRIQSARQELARILHRETPVATPDLSLEILGPLVDSILVGGESPWPAARGAFEEDSGPVLSHFAVGFNQIEGNPIFVLDTHVPPEIANALGSRALVVDSATWTARPRRLGGVLLEVFPVRADGPFVLVNWRWTEYERRSLEESPSGYAGGGSLWLLRTDDGWQVVGRGAWIT